jgi:hypothetical protein
VAERNDAAIREKLVMVEQMALDLRIPSCGWSTERGGGSVKNIEIEGMTHLPQHAVLENLRRQPVAGAGRRAGARLGGRSRRSARRRQPLLGDRQGHGADVRGRPAGCCRASARCCERNELGGSEIHTRNGAIDDEAASEAEGVRAGAQVSFHICRTRCTSCRRAATRGRTKAPSRMADRRDPRDSRKVYKMRPIVEALVDEGTFCRDGRRWGRSVITGFARLDGWPVAVMASDPYHYGGAWTADACDKVIRSATLRRRSHLPVVHTGRRSGIL